MKLISIVIPCFNEEEYIEECLDSIVNQTYLNKFIEVIVVDGISTDQSVNKINKYVKSLKNLTILYNKEKITPISLNIGVKYASGDLIMILSAHSYLDRNYIKNAIEILNNNDAICVGGPIYNVGKTFIGKAIALAMQSKFGVGNSTFRVSKIEQYVDTVAFGVYKREIFTKIGYFDENLVRNQDYEYNQRIVNNEYLILQSPEIKSFYYNREELNKLFMQYFNYGFWKVEVIKKNSKTFKMRYQIPALFILILIILLISSIFSSNIVKYLILFLFPYFIISFLNSLYIGFKNSFKYIFLMPIIFFILHSSFGFGIILGFIKKIFIK